MLIPHNTVEFSLRKILDSIIKDCSDSGPTLRSELESYLKFLDDSAVQFHLAEKPPRIVMDDVERVVIIYADAELYDYFRGIQNSKSEFSMFTISRVYLKIKQLLFRDSEVETNLKP